MSTIYAVGNRITITAPTEHDMARYQGWVGTVTEVNMDAEPWVYKIEFDVPDDTTGNFWVLSRFLEPLTTAVIDRPDGLHSTDGNSESYALGRDKVVTPANATYADLYAVITSLSNDLAALKDIAQTRLDTLQREQDRVSELRGRYVKHMRHWEDTLRQAKEDQSWCDEGTNAVIDILNDGFDGAWEIERYRKLVKSRVRIRGEVTDYIEVYHLEDDDADDPDCWLDEDGDAIDGNEQMTAALMNELENVGFDTVETI